MSTIHDSTQVGEACLGTRVGHAAVVCDRVAAGADRRQLEDEHTRILGQAVGDHLPYELALRAAVVATQLERSA